ncbi:MAG TPA: hypothetical protein ENI67_04840 [Gammaproteobacteria bacterium]|nr:hypothetical protein [Gammaproteobacteria bacterium]
MEIKAFEEPFVSIAQQEALDAKQFRGKRRVVKKKRKYTYRRYPVVVTNVSTGEEIAFETLAETAAAGGVRKSAICKRIQSGKDYHGFTYKYEGTK